MGRFVRRIHLWQQHPYQSEFINRIVFFDMKLQFGLVIGRNKSKVGTVRIGVQKIEVAGMQPYRNRDVDLPRPRRFADLA